ncbi:MAG: hypothetical protein ACXV7J_08790 [Methylomonas sp.]
MKFYKDENNNVYAYTADGSQDAYILPNLIAITQEEADALRIPPPSTAPNFLGFIANIKAALGGVVPLNALMRQYPAFSDALNMAEWADVRDLLVDAKTLGVITSTQYTDFQVALTANNIPVVLP